ncbi:MAG: DUF3179 domain-containing protein [Rhodothermales bacterium]
MLFFSDKTISNSLPSRHILNLFSAALILILAGCDSGDTDTSLLNEDDCSIPVGQVVSGGVAKDGIPSLQNPTLVEAGSAAAVYLQPENRVIGVVIDGEPVAIPHNILWWHEIVNLDLQSSQLAISYCPLTGSSIAFDRAQHDGATFGVSGLLWQNNLIMYDRNTDETLWPQMLREGGCGTGRGQELTAFASSEMSWSGWQRLHPGTRVVSNATGFTRNYTESGYPYGNYEEPDNAGTLFTQDVNDDRPPKERVLGIPVGQGGKLYPFFELNATASASVVNDFVDGRPVVVFWDNLSEGAVAFESVLNGNRFNFAVNGDQFVDQETGSTWDLQGRAISGEMMGTQLTPVAEAYVAFWFAWKAFHPQSEVWLASGN